MGTAESPPSKGHCAPLSAAMMAWKALPPRAKLRWARRFVGVLTFVVLLASAVHRAVRDQRSVTSILQRASFRGAVLVTASNFMYRAHLRNFQCSLRRLSLPYAPIVFSLDVKTHKFARGVGLASIALSDEPGDDVMPGEFERRGPRSFGTITRQKIATVLPALEAGLDVLVSDSDIHWCGDAIKELQDMDGVYATADVMIMAEAGYEKLNSGFYYVRANERTKLLFAQLVENLKFGNHDQDVVNAVFCTGFGAQKVMQENDAGVPYWCVARDGAEIRLLPAELFPTGNQMLKGRNIFKYGRHELAEMCEKKKFLVLHNNFIRARQKRARCIVKGMWFAEATKEEKSRATERDMHMRCLDSPIRAGPKAKRLCGIYC